MDDAPGVVSEDECDVVVVFAVGRRALSAFLEGDAHGDVGALDVHLGGEDGCVEGPGPCAGAVVSGGVVSRVIDPQDADVPFGEAIIPELNL